MQTLANDNYPIRTTENIIEPDLFENKMEHFLHKLVKIWFAGIFIFGIPYFLFICLQFLLQYN